MDARVILTKLTRKALASPARLASQALALSPVRHHLARRYERAKAAYRCKLAKLSRCHEEIVEGVRARGVYVTTLDALGFEGSKEMLAACAKLAAKYERMHRSGEMNGRDAFQAGAAELLANPITFEWGLNERLLDIVENYLEQPAAYDGLNLFYTKADGRQVAARKWHRDLEDRRVLKVAIYVNDVDDDGGPFEILNRSVPGLEADAAPHYPVFTLAQLERRIGAPLDPASVTTCTGPAGTVVFAETGLFYHRGKPATSRDRCAVFYNYFARAPLRPFFCERSTLSRRQMQTMAQSLNPRQRDCVNWRAVMPLWLRMIPPAPI